MKDKRHVYVCVVLWPWHLLSENHAKLKYFTREYAQQWQAAVLPRVLFCDTGNECFKKNLQISESLEFSALWKRAFEKNDHYGLSILYSLKGNDWTPPLNYHIEIWTVNEKTVSVIKYTNASDKSVSYLQPFSLTLICSNHCLVR